MRMQIIAILLVSLSAESRADQCANLAIEMNANYDSFIAGIDDFTRIARELNIALKLNDQQLIETKEYQRASALPGLKEKIVVQIDKNDMYKQMDCGQDNNGGFDNKAAFMKSFIDILKPH